MATLADFLRPVPVEGSSISLEDIDNVLRSIVMDEPSPENPFLNEEGYYGIGLIEGHARLHLLWELFDAVYIPKAVYEEIVLPDRDKSYGKLEVIQAVQEKKITVYQVHDQSLVEQLYGKLHRGELETIIGG